MKKKSRSSKETTKEIQGFDYFVAKDGEIHLLVEGYFNEDGKVVLISSGENLGPWPLDEIQQDFYWRKHAIDQTVIGKRPILNVKDYQNYKKPRKPRKEKN